ncbi:MAG: TonB-dependent receptor [Calditrichaeota bacterium]|nr:TonB-dependent receptor [Calditrichota bacterium]
MRSKRSAALFALLGLAWMLGTAQAQPTGRIKGTVRDAATGSPLPGANVLIKGTQLGAATDVEGYYVIPKVPPGKYVLVARYIGYKSQEKSVRVRAGEVVECNFKLPFAVVRGKEVVVTAQAEGQIAAINQQLAARSIKSVVSSARIQELPDANAAESVGRLPGVSILRSGGEGNKVVVRGLSPKYNMITVNGVRVPATGRGDRSTDISMISPYMLQGIEVIKAITPDQEADVLGGTVNFRFRKASKRKGLHFDGLAQGGYNGLENKYGDYKFVLATSNRYWKDRLGLFVQADVERRNRSADQLNVGYDILNPSLDRWDKVVARSASFQMVHRIRKRYGASLVLDYQLPHGSLLFSNFWNKTVTDATRRGETLDAGGNTHSYSLSESESRLTLLSNALHFEYELGRHRLDAVVANSRSENVSPLSLSYTFLERSAFWNASGFENPFTLVDSAKNNLDNTYLNSFSASKRNTQENQFTAGANLELSMPVIGAVAWKIKTGVKYRHQYRTNDQDQRQRKFEAYQYARDSVLTHFAWMQEADVGSAVRERVPYRLFVDPNPDRRPFLDGKFTFGPAPRLDLLHQLYDMLRTTPDNVRIGLGGTPLLWKNWPNSIRPDYHGTEDYFGAYIMSEIDIGRRWMVLPGVRYERNRTIYTGNRGDDSRRAEEGYNYEPTTKTRENEYWLPMVHAKFRPTSWLTFHFAYTNTLTRPSYSRIVPSWHLSTTSNQLNYNNYRLRPGRSRNYDLFAAIYQNYVGFFSMGVFQKTIRDLIYNPGPMVVLDPAVWDLPPDLGAEIIVTTVNNKYKAKLWGLELEWQTYFWYLPRPLNGIVLNINYTHIHSETKYPMNRLREVVVGYDTTFVFGQERILPIWQMVNVDTFYTGRIVHQPNHIFNLSLGYDYKGFSARISMLYTDDILTGTNFWEELRSSTDKHVRWDLSVKQKLPFKGLMLYFNLNNFNNAVDRSLIAGSSYPSREEYYDLTWDLGLRYRF